MGLWKSRSGRRSWSSVVSTASRNDSSSLSAPRSEACSAIPAPQTVPILALPPELIQQISSYLSPSASASLSLSSRYLYYAIGTSALSTFLTTSNSSKFERRKNIEILERAFPSHWFCAWCDLFHRHERDVGPKSFEKETRRNCAEFNSYLHNGWAYVVCHHHVKLAVNRMLWGEQFGIGLEAFEFEQQEKRNIGKTRADTKLECEARVADGRLLLHATFHATIPSRATQRFGSINRKLLSTFPQIIKGHRDSHDPHTGMVKCLRSAFQNHGRSIGQLCSVCATDFSVSCQPYSLPPCSPKTTENLLVLKIEVWRDLGNGRNPFDASWRAHGELGNGKEGFSGDVLRLISVRSGDIMRAFESAGPIPHVAKTPLMHFPVRSGLEDLLSRSLTEDIIQARVGSAFDGIWQRRELPQRQVF